MLACGGIWMRTTITEGFSNSLRKNPGSAVGGPLSFFAVPAEGCGPSGGAERTTSAAVMLASINALASTPRVFVFEFIFHSSALPIAFLKCCGESSQPPTTTDNLQLTHDQSNW
jgi:hypothetical protein